jgi:UDP-glucuronate decarboxylase
MKSVDNNSIIREDLSTITSNSLPWESLANKTVLITGGAGFIGAYLVKTLLVLNQLLDLKLRVVCVTRNKTSVKARLNYCYDFPELVVFEQDMSLPLSPDFPSADIMIHAASQASPSYYSKDPVGTLAANVLGTINLLNLAQKNTLDQFLYISSGEVYGELGNAASEITEDSYGYLDPTKVRSCYGESKRMSENICVSYSHQYGIDTRIVRPFHTYGPGLSPSDGRVFADFIHAVAAGNDIEMTSDGSAKRPFCYISDAVTGIFHVLFNGKSSNAYNMGNPDGEVSIKALATIVSEARTDFNVSVKSSVQADSYLKSPISRQIVNIDKLKSLGWAPRISIIDGFKRSVSSEIETLVSK